MTVRAAKFVDIPALCEIMEAHWPRSIYAGTGATIDMPTLKSVLVNAIQRHGRTQPGGTCVYVSERAREQTVEGFIVGVQDRIHGIGTLWQATDLYFVMTDRAPRRDAAGLVSAFGAWASSCPRVFDMVHGTPDIVGTSARAGRVFTAAGYVKYGEMYRKVVTR